MVFLDDGEAIRVEVDQYDIRAVEILTLIDERRHGARRACCRRRHKPF